MGDIIKGKHEILDYHGGFKIRILMNKEYEDYSQHWHSDAEIVMPIENCQKVIVNEAVYQLETDDIIVIPPGELHQLFPQHSGNRIIVQFEGTLFDNLSGFKTALDIFRPCMTVTPSSTPDIHKLLSTLVRNITSEYYSALPFREASLYSYLIRFFTVLGRNRINKNNDLINIKSSKQQDNINQFIYVCNYINDHCTENIKIEEIAHIAGFSKYHFARLFKQVMNISWYDYMINCRVKNAEKLLSDPELSIMQVAMKAGFCSLATFNRVFKVKNCCTPTEYRLNKLLSVRSIS